MRGYYSSKIEKALRLKRLSLTRGFGLILPQFNEAETAANGHS
jgi:hypothetical protein